MHCQKSPYYSLLLSIEAFIFFLLRLCGFQCNFGCSSCCCALQISIFISFSIVVINRHKIFIILKVIIVHFQVNQYSAKGKLFDKCFSCASGVSGYKSLIVDRTTLFVVYY